MANSALGIMVPGYSLLTCSLSKTKTLPCQRVITPGWQTGYLYSWHWFVIDGNKMRILTRPLKNYVGGKIK